MAEDGFIAIEWNYWVVFKETCKSEQSQIKSKGGPIEKKEGSFQHYERTINESIIC